MIKLTISLTLGVLFSTNMHVLASELNNINLPNGNYQSATKYLEVRKNKLFIELSEDETIDIEIKQGNGPTLPGDFLYVHNKEGAAVIVGACKQLDKITCFFEVIYDEKDEDERVLEFRKIVYEIEIVDNKGFLSMSLQKYRAIEGQERRLLKNISEDFYPASNQLKKSNMGALR